MKSSMSLSWVSLNSRLEWAAEQIVQLVFLFHFPPPPTGPQFSQRSNTNKPWHATEKDKSLYTES